MPKFTRKICFVIPSLSCGGAERVVTVLASQLADEGYDIAVIKYFDAPDEYPVSERVKVFCVSPGNEENYKKIPFIKKLKRIRRILCQIRPHYVVPFLPHVAAQVFLAGLGLRQYYVQTIRVAPNIAPASRLLRCFRDFLVAISYVTFVQTETQKAYFPVWMQRKIVVLPNPVSKSILETNAVYREKITRIISVGRLTAQKNFEMLIRSVAELNSAGYPVFLDIYGEGEMKQSLQRMIDSLNCQKVCFLRGRTNRIQEALSNADLFVLASNFEGMPNALMEAMAVGLPCISTNCETGPGELLDDRRGILVPVNDQDAMTGAIKKMIESPHIAAEMGRQAKAYMLEQYSPSAISNRFIHDVIMRGKINECCKKII